MSRSEDEVEYGIDQFSADRTVEIPLRDALYAFKAIGEFVRFFHQPMHYKTLAEVKDFIGDVDEGGLHVLSEAYYSRLGGVWPDDVQEAFNDGKLDRNPFLG